jgi:hypothetical protein
MSDLAKLVVRHVAALPTAVDQAAQLIFEGFERWGGTEPLPPLISATGSLFDYDDELTNLVSEATNMLPEAAADAAHLIFEVVAQT